MSSRSNEIPGVLKILASVFWIGLATNVVSAWALSSPSWSSADFWGGFWIWLTICGFLLVLGGMTLLDRRAKTAVGSEEKA